MAHLAVTQNRLPSRRRLQASLEGLNPHAPIVIMVHGFKYDPACPARSPHRHIFAINPDGAAKRVASWPRRLGLRGPRGLAIGFGWRACGTIWQAHRQAAIAGHRLARLITTLHVLAPAHPIHIVAHSLGARVVLQALQELAPATVTRVILIAAAVFEKELQTALATPAGRMAEIMNIRSRANMLFDLLLRAALPHWGCTAGRGRIAAPNLLDINIDDPATQRALNGAGFSMTRSRPTICHWSGYLRDDVCALYRKLLHRPEQTPLRYLQALTAIKGDHGTVGAAGIHLSF